VPLQIRQLDRVDGSLLRRIRIAALQDAPDQLGETLAQALARSDETWSEYARSVHLAEFDDGPVGMVFAFQDTSDPETGRLGGMWVAPKARRIGVGFALVEAAVSCARNNGKRCVRLWVEPSTQAERLYARANFVFTGAQKLFPDNSRRIVIEMQRELHQAG
jgi:GNAT superfamily N-acetyltransferase